MKNVVLEVKNISKSFGKLKAVSNVSFSIEKGDVFGFIGPNGSGKTTTIRMILGLLKADKGDVFINKFSIKKDFYSAVSKVGALVEGPAFYEYMTAEENLKCFASYSGKVDGSHIKSVLEIVGLSKRAKDKVKGFSLGMKQRLGIAQALLNKPSLLILDEPTNGLDPQGIKDIRKLIAELSEQGVTIFLSSHLLSEVENVCNKIMIIKNGKQIISGDKAELIDNKQIYDIRAADHNILLNKLKRRESISIVSEENDVRIKLDKNIKPENLLKELVNDGIRITKFNPIKISLEEYFFTATGGEK